MSRCAHRLSVPSRTSQLARIRRYVEAWAHEASLPEASAHALQLAVDEACANAIEHGYGGRADGRVEVEAAFPAGALVVTVRHHGDPYDPKAHQPTDLHRALSEHRPHGYGLHLMERLVDEVAFRTLRGASEVSLTQRRPSSRRA